MIFKPIIMGGGEYKCRIFKMHQKLRDQQLKTHKHTYINLWDTAKTGLTGKFIVKKLTSGNKKNLT